MRSACVMRGLAAIVGVCLAAPSASFAASYAALEEVPAGGGELRLASPDGYEDAGGYPAIAFPLKHTRVDAVVQGPMIEVQVEQTFENPFDDPLEAVYVFPLNPDAAVNAYEIIISERVIAGRIEKREEARRIYEEARDAGHTAGLLEQTKPNVFVQSIANIAPRETIVVRFRYVERLDYDLERGYRFVYPMTITRRYLPHDSNERRPVSGGGGATGSTDVPYVEATRSGTDVEIHVKVEAGVPIRGFSSRAHALDARIEDTFGVVSLRGGSAIPNRDFVLDIATAGEQTLTTLLAHRDDELGGFFTLLVQPKLRFSDDELTPREVVLLIDVSGSMGGEPIDRAKWVGDAVLASLTERDTFNVVTFASSTGVFAERPQRATASALAEGRRYVAELRAGGGTRINDGFGRVFAETPPEGRVRLVYVLTDGGVGHDDEVLAAARRPEGDNRIYPVGISEAPNRYLIDRLADEGRGFPTYIGLVEDPSAEILKLVRRSAFPYLTDLSIDWGDLDVQAVTPMRIPDVYAGRPLVVSGRFERGGSGDIVLRGRHGTRTFETRLAVELPETEDRRPVAYLWATGRVRELLAQQYEGEVPRVVEQVTAIGLQFGLVTPYTSFVAVDKERVVEGSSRTVAQPNEVPAGYGGSSSGGYSGGHASGADDDAAYGDAGPLTLVLLAGLLGLAVRRRGEAA